MPITKFSDGVRWKISNALQYTQTNKILRKNQKMCHYIFYQGPTIASGYSHSSASNVFFILSCKSGTDNCFQTIAKQQRPRIGSLVDRDTFCAFTSGICMGFGDQLIILRLGEPRVFISLLDGGLGALLFLFALNE